MSTVEPTPYSHPIHERMTEDVRLPHLSFRTFARAAVRDLVVNGQRHGEVDYLPQGVEYNDLAGKNIMSDDERYRSEYVRPLGQPIEAVTALIDSGQGLQDLTVSRRNVLLQHLAQQQVTDIDRKVRLDLLSVGYLRNKDLPRVAKAAEDIAFMLKLRQRKLHNGVVVLGNEILAYESTPYFALLYSDSAHGNELRLGKLLGFKLVKDEEGLSHSPVLKNRRGQVGLPSDRTEILGLLKRRPPLRLV